MERVSITERPDWREKAHEYGFNFHTMYGEPYWCEDAYYKLTLAQVEKLEEVTAELHQMCLKVVEKVIASDELMTKFRIPKHTWSFVRQSWLTHQPSLYSRLDLAWDGTGAQNSMCVLECGIWSSAHRWRSLFPPLSGTSGAVRR